MFAFKCLTGDLFFPSYMFTRKFLYFSRIIRFIFIARNYLILQFANSYSECSGLELGSTNGPD